jgi:hypothetical protein
MNIVLRTQERKQKNPLDDLENLSRFVYRLNRSDKTSEDYVYYQIIHYLAEYGSFTVTKLDNKIIIYKKINGKKKKIKIERRKLKKILEGTDKEFTGLIPLNYVIGISEWKNRGGKQEKTYYLTEKGIMASIGMFSYKNNINIKKIQSVYKPLDKKYKKFINEFIKSQIQVYLSYYFVQGISLAFKKENDAEYERFRHTIINQFDIKIGDVNLEEQFIRVLQKFNLFRKIHFELFKEKDFLHILWEESHYKINNIDTRHGFQGWYRIQFLTSRDSKLKLIKYKKNKPSEKGIRLVKEPEFLSSRFQENSTSISNASLDIEMIHLGLKKQG